MNAETSLEIWIEFLNQQSMLQGYKDWHHYMPSSLDLASCIANLTQQSTKVSTRAATVPREAKCVNCCSLTIHTINRHGSTPISIHQ